MEIKAADVKALRERTGAGMMECKKALVEANCGYLKVGDRMPNMRIDDTESQLRFA